MSQERARHFRGFDDAFLQRFADQQQRRADELQRQAGQAQRVADAARKELRKRERGGKG